MENFIIAKANGTATVLFEPTVTELGNIGYGDPFELEEDFRYHLENNFPGLLGFVDIDTNSRFMNVFCETEEIAEVVNEELNHLIRYREIMVDEAMNFEGGLDMDQINEAIDELEKTLAKLKNLLV